MPVARAVVTTTTPCSTTTTTMTWTSTSATAAVATTMLVLVRALGPEAVSAQAALASARRRRRSQAVAATFQPAQGLDRPRPKSVPTRKKTGTYISSAMLIVVLIPGRSCVTIVPICVFVLCVIPVLALLLSPDFRHVCALDSSPLWFLVGRGGKLLVLVSGAEKKERFRKREAASLGQWETKGSIAGDPMGGMPLEAGFCACSRLWPSQDIRASLTSFARFRGRAASTSHGTNVFLHFTLSYLPIDRLGASTLASVAKLREPRPRQVVYRAEWPQDETPAVSTLVCCIQELDGREHSRQVPSFSVATTCQRARDR